MYLHKTTYSPLISGSILILFGEFFIKMFVSNADKSRNVAGLGLSICKSIVKGHGGKIYAKNNSYGGLTIMIVLKRNN